MDITSHPLFVPAAGVIAALALFAIVLYASSRKPQKRKNLQAIEAERFTGGVEGVKFVEENGAVVRRSTRLATDHPLRPTAQGLRPPGRPISHPPRPPRRLRKAPAAEGDFLTPAKVSPEPSRWVCTRPTDTSHSPRPSRRRQRAAGRQSRPPGRKLKQQQRHGLPGPRARARGRWPDRACHCEADCGAA
jgi:hypothetical protein